MLVDITYAIKRKARDEEDETMKGFYHPDSPVLFAEHDKITTTDDCPFPLKTDTFEVLLWGVSIKHETWPPKEGERDTTRDTFCVVRHTKECCGHTVEDRVGFQEGVEDFDHHGTEFVGADYSAGAWERRIELFRQWPCDICGMVIHNLWCYGYSDTVTKRGEFPDIQKELEESSPGFAALKKGKGHAAGLRLLLDANWLNWDEFIDWEAYCALLDTLPQGRNNDVSDRSKWRARGIAINNETT